LVGIGDGDKSSILLGISCPLNFFFFSYSVIFI